MRSIWLVCILLFVPLLGKTAVECPTTLREFQVMQTELVKLIQAGGPTTGIRRLLSTDVNSSDIVKQYWKCRRRIKQGNAIIAPTCFERISNFIYEIRKSNELRYEASENSNVPPELLNEDFLASLRSFPPDFKGAFGYIESLNKHRAKDQKILAVKFKNGLVSGLETKQKGRFLVVVPGNPSKVLALSYPTVKAKESGQSVDAAVISLSFDPKRYRRGKKVATKMEFNDVLLSRGMLPKNRYKHGDQIDCHSCHNGHLRLIMTSPLAEPFAAKKEAINKWMTSIDYQKIIDRSRFGPPIGEDRSRDIAEIRACAKRNRGRLRDYQGEDRGAMSLGIVSDSMRCAKCHAQGKESFVMNSGAFALNSGGLGKDLRTSIIKGWMPKHGKIALNDYEKNLLYMCLTDEYFGYSDSPGVFANWLGEEKCTIQNSTTPLTQEETAQ